MPRPARPGGRTDELTPHEQRVLGMLVDGKQNSEIAEVLRRSRHTVDKQVKSILHKTGQRNRTTLAVMAVRTGLVD